MRSSDTPRCRRPGAGAVVAACVGLLCAIPSDAVAQSWRTVTMSRQKVVSPDELNVRVSYGTGRFRIRPHQGDLLYRMHLRYDEDTFEPRAELEGDRLRLGVENLGRNLRIGGGRSSGEMRLELGTGVPMDLRLDFGAVEADVDLGGLSLTGLHLTTGASDSRVDVSSPNPVLLRHAEMSVGAAGFTARHLGNLNAENISVSAGVGDVTLDFTGEWRRDARVTVGMGLGSLRLRFPEGLGVRLEKDTFLTSLNSEGMVKRGDAYYSMNWDEATRRIVVKVDAAFGSIDVAWLR